MPGKLKTTFLLPTPLLIWPLLLVLAGPAAATVYFVAPNGVDTNAGTTIGAAFATPQAALNAATQPGDVVSILPGKVYGGGTGSVAPLVLSHSGSGAGTAPGGACTAPITIEGYPLALEHPVIAGVEGATGAGAIYATGVSCIVITGLDLAGWNGALTWGAVSINALASGNSWQSTLESDYGVYISGAVGNPAHHIIVQNVYVHDFPGGGIGFVYSDYLSVLNNRVENNAQYSAFSGSDISLYQLQNLDPSVGVHNIVAGNWASGSVNLVPNRSLPLITTTATAATNAGANTISVASAAGVNYTMAVMSSSSACLPPGTVVNYVPGNNVVGFNGYAVCTVNVGDTIGFGYPTDGHGIIIDNSSCSQTPGCTTPYTARTLVINNITTGNGAAGLQCGPGSSGCNFEYNTSYLDQVGAYIVGNNYSPGGISVLPTNAALVVGNIVYAGPQVAVAWDQGAGGAVWGSNLFYGGIFANFGHSIPGSDSVLGNPLFVAPGPNWLSANFRLQPGSPALGKAPPAFTRVTDYYASPAPTPDAIGAAEGQ